MLKDFSGIKLQGANFSSPTILPILDSSDGKEAKLSLVYGRNGSGKSTIAKAIRSVSGEDIQNITVSVPLNTNSTPVNLSDTERASIFVFDEDFVTANVRIEGSGLGSIVMLGEQADLSVQIEAAIKNLSDAEKVVKEKDDALREYKTSSNPKAPKFYIEKIKTALSSGTDCWADRERRAKEQRRNSSVNDETYKKFIKLTPKKTRDELVVSFKEKMEELASAKSGTSTIGIIVPGIPDSYKKYSVQLANELLKKKIEKPELTERERYLLSLVTTGQSDELQRRIENLNDDQTTYCPYCLQDLSQDYKLDLITRIQKILTDEVKHHQSQLKALMISELEVDLSLYADFPSYKSCSEFISSLNETIRTNNELIQKKVNASFTPIMDEEMNQITENVQSLEKALNKLEEERAAHNKTAVKTQPIVDELVSINDQIAYYDVIELSRQLETQKRDMSTAQKAYDEAVVDRNEKKKALDELNGRRKRIDIAIDIINSGLKYILFSDDRLTIERDGDFYKLLSNGCPVEPKNVSVGERNIIGLCYFFTKILKEKNKDTAYNDEYLIVVDDPVSSYDFENKIGILSFLKYKLGQFLKGNSNTRAIVMTHDLLTMFDLEKMAKELNADWDFPGVKTKYCLNELKDCCFERFRFKDRQEYTELVKLIFEYGNGNATEYDIVIGNIMRQALEAFSTFEYKKGIEAVSTDENILDASGMCQEHKAYFKNLMYRVVLNGGSHREEQTRSLELDFLSVISETEKRRTAQEILCFIYLLNKAHLLAHLGDVSGTLDVWCESVKSRSALP